MFVAALTEMNGITIEHGRLAINAARWLTDCTIRWCSAEYTEGEAFPLTDQEMSPVFLRDGRVVGCTFHNNRSGIFGGAVKLSGRSVIANSRFISNNSRTGGAIGTTFQTPAEVVVQSSFFSGNSASGRWGGFGAVIYNSSLNPAATQLVHCTIVGNWVEDGDGLSVLATGGGSEIQNSIVDQNFSYAGTSPETEIGFASPALGFANTVEANVFRRFNENIEFSANLPRVRMNSGSDPGFVSLLGPDGVLGTEDDDPTLGFDSASIGHTITQTNPALAWGVDTGLFDIADLDGDCDVREPIPVDIFGNPRAVESVPGEGIDGNAADAGCAEFIPGPHAKPGQAWTFIDPKITDFSSHPIRIYVDASRPEGGDGTSWASAFTSPSQALDIAAKRSGEVEIWVATGEYSPTTERSGIRSFRMLETVTMLGGFAGNETAAAQRDWEKNPTVLTGDILRNDDLTEASTLLDNAQHLVTSLGPRGGGVVDGFTLRDGSPSNTPFGPGLFWVDQNGLGGARAGGLVFLGAGDVTIRNSVLGPVCFGYTITGASSVPFIVTSGQQANLRIEHSSIIYDARDLVLQGPSVPRITHDVTGQVFQPIDGSGQVLLSDCEVQIYNGSSLIADYTAGPIDIVRSKISTNYSGNAFQNQLVRSESTAPVTFSDSLVISNSIGLRSQDICIDNSTFMANTFGVNSVGIAADRSVLLTNSVVAANWLIAGVQPEVVGTTFAGTIAPSVLIGYGPTNTTFDFATNASAFFIDPVGPDGLLNTGDDDLRLTPGSPAINTGLNEFVTSEFDRDGNPRIIGSVVDRGAHEFTGTCTGDVNGSGTVDLDDLNIVLTLFGQECSR